MLNFNFSLNQRLLERYNKSFKKAIKDHWNYIQDVVDTFKIQNNNTQPSGEAEQMCLILYSVICVITKKKYISYGEFILKMELISDFSQNMIDINQELFKNIKDIDFNIFPIKYVIDFNKKCENNNAIEIIESYLQDNDFYKDLNIYEEFNEFKERCLLKAIKINKEMHDKEYFATISNSLLAKVIMCRYLKIIISIPVYNSDFYPNDNDLEIIIKKIFKKEF
jgi:hypothetical protein